MRGFGIEFEFCYVVERKDTWYNCIKQYISVISANYNSDVVINAWLKKYNNTIIVQDDDNNMYKVNIVNNEIKLVKNYVHTYNYPLITYDSSVICHNTLRKKNSTNYKLNNVPYSINIEVVSPIMYDIDELISFDTTFISGYNIILNKSQGIHLTLDILNVSNEELFNILTQQYYPWEKLHNKRVRPINSCWSQVLTNNNITRCQTKQFRNTLHKQKSVHYKNLNHATLLEFRLQSSMNKNYINDSYDIYNMFSKVNGGRKRNRTRKYRR